MRIYLWLQLYFVVGDLFASAPMNRSISLCTREAWTDYLHRQKAIYKHCLFGEKEIFLSIEIEIALR